MKQTRPHLQISPLGLVNKYGSKNPKTSQKQESHRAYDTHSCQEGRHPAKLNPLES